MGDPRIVRSGDAQFGDAQLGGAQSGGAQLKAKISDPDWPVPLVTCEPVPGPQEGCHPRRAATSAGGKQTHSEQDEAPAEKERMEKMVLKSPAWIR